MKMSFLCILNFIYLLFRLRQVVLFVQTLIYIYIFQWPLWGGGSGTWFWLMHYHAIAMLEECTLFWLMILAQDCVKILFKNTVLVVFNKYNNFLIQVKSFLAKRVLIMYLFTKVRKCRACAWTPRISCMLLCERVDFYLVSTALTSEPSLI